MTWRSPDGRATNQIAHGIKVSSLKYFISKMFCRMLLERIKDDVNKRLRKEQAGFRPERSTMEQIFILKNILNRRMYTHFADFEKAFDSVHRESLSSSMRTYVPRYPPHPQQVNNCWTYVQSLTKLLKKLFNFTLLM